MIRHTERRSDIRDICRLPISVQESNNIYIYRARLVNFSAKGMYIETEIALDVGTDLIVGIEDSKLTLSTAAFDVPVFFRAKIMWQKVSTKSIFNFGYGTKLIFVADDQNVLDTALPVEHELRKHPRKSYKKVIFFTYNDQYSKGLIDNISRGGVFVVTHENLSVGQTIKFVIPGTKFDNGVMLKGEVVYTSQKGVGVKLMSLFKGRKTTKDRGGTRSSADRRSLFFSEYNPEKRSAGDRRIREDRRSPKNLKYRGDLDLSGAFRDLD